MLERAAVGEHKEGRREGREGGKEGRKEGRKRERERENQNCDRNKRVWDMETSENYFLRQSNCIKKVNTKLCIKLFGIYGLAKRHNMGRELVF
jgi:hypothetical protein